MNKPDVVRALLGERRGAPRRDTGTAFASANIALCKYWGKRDEELNLPVTSSLSISLGPLGTHTTIALANDGDRVFLNGAELDPQEDFASRCSDFLDLFRGDRETFFKIETRNTIPTAAGLASSASGFAAMVMALNDLLGWGADSRALSILARMGSGSAARSIHTGFVEWLAGSTAEGMDSFAEPLKETWPDLRIGLLTVSAEKKPIGSRMGMKRTQETSGLYEAWPVKVAHDLVQIKAAIRDLNFGRLGRSAESNALAMHATMMAAWPPLLYWKAESVETMHKIWGLREEGLDVFFTMDAGPNIKLLFLEGAAPDVLAAFPEARVVAPFEVR